MLTVDTTILSWDRSEETLAAITSALNQQGIDQHVVVVDQGSRPENIQALKEFSSGKPQLDIVYNEVNNGVPGGRNQASQQGDGHYIVALDNDAEFIDEFQVAKAVEIMEKNPEVAVLAFRILRFGSKEDDWTSWAYGSTDSSNPDSSFFTTRFVGAGHMIRRSAFDQVGGYDDRLFFMHEELDLAIRLINSGYKIQYTNEVVIGHKVSKEHRVPWTSTRTLYDTRNSLYLAAKLDTYHGVLNTVWVMFRHFKNNLKRGNTMSVLKGTLKGCYQGLLLIPTARKLRNRHPETRFNEQAEAYYQTCSSRINRTFFQKVARKLNQNLG